MVEPSARSSKVCNEYDLDSLDSNSSMGAVFGLKRMLYATLLKSS